MRPTYHNIKTRGSVYGSSASVAPSTILLDFKSMQILGLGDDAQRIFDIDISFTPPVDWQIIEYKTAHADRTTLSNFIGRLRQGDHICTVTFKFLKRNNEWQKVHLERLNNPCINSTVPLKSSIVSNGFKDFPVPNSNVSSREQEVLQLLSEGFSSKEIAHKLSISNHTATSHRKNLIEKFGARNTVHLIKKAWQHISF